MVVVLILKDMTKAIVLHITNRCNFNCSFCVRNHSIVAGEKITDRDLAVPVFKEILVGGKKNGIQENFFSGGEPILHPYFRELIWLTSKYNYKFGIISNGWFFEDYWPIIKGYWKNIFELTFSLDGATAAVHDLIRNKRSSFKRTIN